LAAPQGALAADAAAETKLRQKLGSLTLRRPVAIATPAVAKEVAGRRYGFPKNPQAIEAITLSPEAGEGAATELSVVVDGVENRVKVSGESWTRGDLQQGPSAGKVAVSGAWTAADTFTLDVVRYQTPFVARYLLKFSADGGSVTLETAPNVGPAVPPVVGRRE
jgi:hypothetical protein